MPNFWTKTSQSISEAFNGPRTKDSEFENKIEELKIVEKGVSNLKLVFQNFLNQTISIRSMCRDVYTSVKHVYDRNSSYHPVSNDVYEVHVEMEKIYDNFYASVTALQNRTSEWGAMFNAAKAEIEKRSVLRKSYDHYDEKLEKLYKGKLDKQRRGVNETAKDIELLNRNEEKFKKATETYANQSSQTFDSIDSALDGRYEIINPVLTSFVYEEMMFFTSVADLMKRLGNIGGKFQSISKSIVKKPNTYDPCKYIRGGELIKRSQSPDSKLNNHVDDNGIKNRSKSTVHASKEAELKYINRLNKQDPIEQNFSMMNNKFSNNNLNSGNSPNTQINSNINYNNNINSGSSNNISQVNKENSLTNSPNINQHTQINHNQNIAKPAQDFSVPNHYPGFDDINVGTSITLGGGQQGDYAYNAYNNPNNNPNPSPGVMKPQQNQFSFDNPVHQPRHNNTFSSKNQFNNSDNNFDPNQIHMSQSGLTFGQPYDNNVLKSGSMNFKQNNTMNKSSSSNNFDFSNIFPNQSGQPFGKMQMNSKVIQEPVISHQQYQQSTYDTQFGQSVNDVHNSYMQSGRLSNIEKKEKEDLFKDFL